MMTGNGQRSFFGWAKWWASGQGAEFVEKFRSDPVPCDLARQAHNLPDVVIASCSIGPYG